MSKYVVDFHGAGTYRLYSGVGWVRYSFGTLKGARFFAKQYANAHIYRVEWTENGWQATRELKVLY